MLQIDGVCRAMTIALFVRLGIDQTNPDWELRRSLVFKTLSRRLTVIEYARSVFQ